MNTINVYLISFLKTFSKDVVLAKTFSITDPPNALKWWNVGTTWRKAGGKIISLVTRHLIDSVAGGRQG